MKWLEIVPQDVLFGRNCFHMGWRCSPVRGARWEQWEGSLLPPHPSPQPFSALPRPAFLKPVFFLEGPSRLMFLSPLGRSSKPPLCTQLPKKLPPPAPGLHQACTRPAGTGPHLQQEQRHWQGLGTSRSANRSFQGPKKTAIKSFKAHQSPSFPPN